MLFNSLHFLVFFPVVTALYFLLPHRGRWFLLLTASCWFYMAYIPVYILILFLTIVIDYFAGLWIERAQGSRRKLLLILSILSNCGVLGFFKYHDFFAGSMNNLFASLGVAAHMPLYHLILPIGLSFHTFQAMSYTIEVYRGAQRAERHFGIYSLYVMFYPQLVAGPIERPQNLIHQFYEKHTFDAQGAADGLRLMLWGFVKKIVVADNLAVLVNTVYVQPDAHNGMELTLATVFFSFQIYCDFSGYSDIAIGAARVMGFKLMTNFNHPYSALSVGEFWRRWHISLSTWFRDYLYVPLGGSRVARPRLFLNLFIVFLVSGLWHGANWTFVAWGALHGLCLLGELTLKPRLEGRLPRSLGTDCLTGRVVRVAWVFTFVSFAWILFRAANMTDAWYIVTHLASGWNAGGAWATTLHDALSISPFESIVGIAGIAAMETVHLLQRRRGFQALADGTPRVVRWALYVGAILAILLLGNLASNSFIYFQF